MKMKKLLCIIFALLLCSVPAIAAETRTFFAMDTYMSISAPTAGEELVDECVSRVNNIEKLMSVTDAESEIYGINSGSRADISADTQALLEFALEMCAKTDGTLDITMYPVVQAWGFTTGEYRVPTQAEIDELLQNVGYDKIRIEGDTVGLPEGFMLDLGSVAKGYASDVIADMLRDGGVESALVDLGGNLYCVGAKADGSDWKVGLRDPMGGDYLGYVTVQDCAVVTSGCYERYFEEDGIRYGHIFDPSTGYPADNGLISVTVIGKSGARCDALSTALYVMGPEAAADYLAGDDSVEAVLVKSDGGLIITKGLEGIFTPLGGYVHSETEWIE